MGLALLGDITGDGSCADRGPSSSSTETPTRYGETVSSLRCRRVLSCEMRSPLLTLARMSVISSLHSGGHTSPSAGRSPRPACTHTAHGALIPGQYHPVKRLEDDSIIRRAY